MSRGGLMIQKILIVDDSMLARMAVRKCLSDLPGLEIHEASDGVEGLAKFIEHSPDLTLCDLTMPKMNGFEALRLMRNASPDALIIVLTADTQRSTLERVNAGGAFMVLNKPPRREEVLNAFGKATERAKGAA